METTSETNLTLGAARHARRIQWIIAAAVALVWITQILMRVSNSLDSLSFVENVIAPAVFVAWGTLVSIFAAWSSIWIVLGSGRGWAQWAVALGIFHGSVALGWGFTEAIELFDSDSPDWRESLALLSAMSYAFSGQLFCCSLAIWLMKVFRFRLLYFHDAAAYPHPRRLAREVAVADRPQATVLRSRVSITDIIALTTLVAIYMAAWYPLVEVALKDNSMFGASFVFIVILVICGFNAAVALPVVLLPGVIAMIDHRGRLFQLVCHASVFAVATATLVVLIAMRVIEEEGVSVSIAAVITFVAYEGLLYFAMGKPVKWFRFRLVRLSK